MLRTILLIIGFLPVFASMASAADPQYAVPRDGFDCLLRHSAKYFESGERIFVKFDTCPQLPSAEERMDMLGAKNVFPTNNASADAESPSLLYTNEIVLTRRMLDCLRKNRREVLESATADRVFILPDVCAK